MQLELGMNYVAVSVAVFVAASVRGVLGLGFALVVVPVLQFLAPEAVPVVVLLLTLPLSVFMAIRERVELDLRGLGHLVIGRLVGTIPGVLIVVRFPRPLLSVFVGASLVAASVLSLVRRNGAASGAWTRFLLGVAAGAVGTVAAVGGPILAFAYRGRPGGELRSTLSAAFIVGQVLSLAGLGIADQVRGAHVVYAAMLLPPLAAGLLFSRFLIPMVDRHQLRYGILVLAAVAGVGAILRGVAGWR